jgi:hypothetical protein
MNMKVKDILKFKRTFLRKLRPEMEGDRESWERFVIIRADGREGMSMYPRLLPSATVLIDPTTIPSSRIARASPICTRSPATETAR